MAKSTRGKPVRKEARVSRVSQSVTGRAACQTCPAVVEGCDADLGYYKNGETAPSTRFTLRRRTFEELRLGFEVAFDALPDERMGRRLWLSRLCVLFVASVNSRTGPAECGLCT